MTYALGIEEKGKTRVERTEILLLPGKAKKAAVCRFAKENNLSGLSADLIIDGGIVRESVVPKAGPRILKKMAQMELSSLSPSGKRWIMVTEPYKRTQGRGIRVTGAMLEEDKLTRILYCMKEAGIRVRRAYLLASRIGSLAGEETMIIVSREGGGFRVFLIEEGLCILTRTVMGKGEKEGETLSQEIRRILLSYQSRSENQRRGEFSIEEIRFTSPEGEFPEPVRKEMEESLGLPCRKLELEDKILTYKLAAAIAEEEYTKGKLRDLLRRKRQAERRALARRFRLPVLVLPLVLTVQIAAVFAIGNYLKEKGRQEYSQIEELREYVENPERISRYREKKAAIKAFGERSARDEILKEEKLPIKKKKSLDFSDYQVLLTALGEGKRITGISFREEQLTLELELKDENTVSEVSSRLKAADQYESVWLSGWEGSLDGQSILAQLQIKLREKPEIVGEGGKGIEAY